MSFHSKSRLNMTKKINNVQRNKTTVGVGKCYTERKYFVKWKCFAVQSPQAVWPQVCWPDWDMATARHFGKDPANISYPVQFMLAGGSHAGDSEREEIADLYLKNEVNALITPLY